MSLNTSAPSSLRAFLIAPNLELAAEFKSVADSIDTIKIARTLTEYPSPEELIRLIRIYVPHMIFIDAGTMGEFADIYRALHAEVPTVRVAALHESCSSEVLLQLMRLGVQECLTAPFTDDSVRDCFGRVTRELHQNPVALQGTDLVYSFLPAKPGVGATTLAVNAALAAARMLGNRVFLGDFDLNCGLVRFMLKLGNGYTTADAAERSTELDEELWPRMVNTVDSLDVIHAGQPRPETRIDMLGLRRLLSFVRRMYKVACFDLSGNLEKYSIDIMHESKRIFLVTTPELPALYLAREKRQLLDSLDLGDRVTVLLNRSAKSSTLTPTEIEQLLGSYVHLTFPNDYVSVHGALSEGKSIPTETELGTHCAALAHYMVHDKLPMPQPARKRFVEYFSLVPATFRLQRS
jgi:pilus assembly protein CpaE